MPVPRCNSDSTDVTVTGTHIASKEGTETMRKTGWCETCKHRSTLNKRQCPYVMEGLRFAEANAKSCPKWEKG